LHEAIVNEPESGFSFGRGRCVKPLNLKLRSENAVTNLGSCRKNLGITFVFVTHDQEEALAPI